MTLISAEEDLTVDWKYSVDGGDLMGFLSKDQCLHFLKQPVKLWGEEENESFDLLFMEGDMIRISCRRQ